MQLGSFFCDHVPCLHHHHVLAPLVEHRLIQIAEDDLDAPELGPEYARRFVDARLGLAQLGALTRQDLVTTLNIPLGHAMVLVEQFATGRTADEARKVSGKTSKAAAKAALEVELEVEKTTSSAGPKGKPATSNPISGGGGGGGGGGGTALPKWPPRK